MQQLTDWSNTKSKIDIFNSNYKNLYLDASIDVFTGDYLIQSKYGAPGKLIFLILCDNKIPVGHHLYNGLMPDPNDSGSECEFSDGENDWNAQAVPNTLWKNSARRKNKHVRSGTLTLPVSGSLYVPVTLQSVTIFGDNIASHAGMLILNADLKNIEFFEPNGITDMKHEHWIKAVRGYTDTLAPGWSFIDLFYPPHEWYKPGHGVCALWCLAYLMLRLDNTNHDVITHFFKDLGYDRASNMLSNLILHILDNTLKPTKCKRIMDNYTIPMRYLPYLPSKYQ